MLRPDEAHAQLRNVYFHADWAARRAQAARRLRQSLSDIVRGLLGVDAHGAALPYTQQADASGKALAALHELNAADRQRVFETLFPKIAPHVEAGWLLHRRLPYQIGYMRRAFRAPGLPDLSRSAQSAWLTNLLRILTGYDEDVVWMAAWAPYLTMVYQADTLGVLFAAAIEGGGTEGDAVYDTLAASARGEHEIGAMGRHVSRALLIADRPEGWTLIENMLVAAQREEGLRQVILETVDEAHPEAFRRMLRLIREQGLARFAAVIRAANVWLGFQHDVFTQREVEDALARIEALLTDPAERARALDGDPQDAYLALWALAHEDAAQALASARRLLADDKAERRFVAVHMLDVLGFEQALCETFDAQADPDPRVAARAVSAVCARAWTLKSLADTDLFERLEGVLARWPASKTWSIGPVVWPWMTISLTRDQVASALIPLLGRRPVSRLLPHLAMMDVSGRIQVAMKLAEAKHWDDDVRRTLFELVGDRARVVRERALHALSKVKPTPDEIAGLEFLLNSSGERHAAGRDVAAAQPAGQGRAGQRRAASRSIERKAA